MEKSFIDDPRISSVVFFPRKAPIPNNIKSHVIPLAFKIHDNITIGGYMYKKDVNLPTILFFHGNGEIALDYQYLYHFFFKINVNLAVMDFRGYGHSSGEPTYSSLYADAFPIWQKFMEWMRDNRLRGSIFVEGRSLGSTCAAEIGAQSPKDLKGIIFESSFASAYNMMTRLFRINDPRITPVALEEYSNDTRMRRIKKPVLIIHGTLDWIIPKSEAELIFNALPDIIEKKLVLIEGAGHNDILSHEQEYFQPLGMFIQKHEE
ncbi:MAG: alpha/beta hydrolase [Promethearchaeota archaeon]